jgi:hypothetical protein
MTRRAFQRAPFIAAFRQGLKETGYVHDRVLHSGNSDLKNFC